MNIAISPTKIKRRELFGMIPATLAIAATGAQAFKMPDAPVDDIPDWYADWKRRHAALADIPPEDEERFDAAVMDLNCAGHAIMTAEPKSIEGVICQLEIALEDECLGAGTVDQRDVTMARNIIEYLRGVA